MSKTIIRALLIGFSLSILLIGFSLYLFYSSLNSMVSFKQIDTNSTTLQYNESQTKLDFKNSNSELSQSEWDKFLESKISGILLGSTISTTISLLLYFLNRKNAKRQLVFDIALKNLLPAVYMPILGELRQHKFKNEDINIHKIESIILDNGSLINFSPKKIQNLLDELFSLCKSIDTPGIYKDKEDQLIEKLDELEKEIMRKFGALIG